MMIDMKLSQTGLGERDGITRLMSRLTMAKLLELMNCDIQDFIFYKEDYNMESYYPYEAVMSDIVEFLDAIDADYYWDENDFILTLNFATKVKNLGNLVDSFSFGWSEIEYGDEDELDHIVEYFDNGLRINLEDYEGAPMMFFKAYYNILKENKLI